MFARDISKNTDPMKIRETYKQMEKLGVGAPYIHTEFTRACTSQRKNLSHKYAPEFLGTQRKTINYKTESIHQKSSTVALGMEQCPSIAQGFSFSCDSSNRVC